MGLDGEQIENWSEDLTQEADPARENFRSHTLWGTHEPGAPEVVVVGGLGVCKVCGAGEMELYESSCEDRPVGHFGEPA